MEPLTTSRSSRVIGGPYAPVFQPHLFAHALGHGPTRPVLKDQDGLTFTARDVQDLTSIYCQALSAAGLRPQDRVGILSGNRLEVLHVTHAAMLGDLVIVPMHPMGALEDYLYVVEDAAVDALVFDPTVFEERAAELRRHCPQIRRFLSFGPSEVGDDLLAIAQAQTPGPLPRPELRGDSVYRLSYTGGTTGRPKAVIGTQDYALAFIQIMMAEWEWPAELRLLICTPLSHSGAPLFLPTLLRGGTAVVLPRFDPEAVMRTIQQERITCTLMVPTMIYALLDHPRIDEFDLSSLETIFYGAAPMSPQRLREGIARFGHVFFQFYGQAEAPLTVTVLRRDEHDADSLERLASCGRAVPWVHVALLDDAGNQVPDGEPGEICVRGPLVMAGYLNKREQTEEALANGWLHTGDVAVRDADGYLYIVDRKKDMIITGGFNVYPREVEDVLGRHPAVAQCAVIGLPDARWGESVAAIVVLRAGAEPCTEELIELVRASKGPVQAPKIVAYADALPVTALGKIDKQALRQRYGTGG
jgi:fatty-acyl-CoA synthase